MNGREDLARCPWCDSPDRSDWGAPVRGFVSALCDSCGLIYVKNRYDAEGLARYYRRYYSNVHQAEETLTELLERADRRLYRAKALGKNRVEGGVASPPNPKSVSR